MPGKQSLREFLETYYVPQWIFRCVIKLSSKNYSTDIDDGEEEEKDLSDVTSESGDLKNSLNAK